MADHPAARGIGEVAVGAAQERLDPAHQLAQAERLGQVVVGAELEADDLVDLVVACRQHQDGRLGAGRAEPAQDLEAVDARQAHVEHDEVRRLARGELEPLLAGPGDGDLVALLLEGVLDAARDGELVFDDQDGGGHARCYTGSALSACSGPTRTTSWYPGALRAPRHSGPAGEPLPDHDRHT